MDILVMLEERPDAAAMLAHVNSVPSPLTAEAPQREVVTMYGDASPESLAFALAAAVEGRKTGVARRDSVRHLGVWSGRAAVGDAAWRDAVTGELVTRDVAIPLDTLALTARHLLDESGPAIRRLAADLTMPDWPEGMRRAIAFSLPAPARASGALGVEAFLESLRELDGYSAEVDEN
jgi:hypothetical protein